MALIRQMFGEENICRTQIVETHPDRKNVRQVNSKVKIMLFIFFDIKVIVHKELVLAGQPVPGGIIGATCSWSI
jgi:hypothetical protein